MTEADLSRWFDELHAKCPRADNKVGTAPFFTTEANAWRVEIEAATAASLPTSHPARVRLSAALAKLLGTDDHNTFKLGALWTTLVGCFDAVFALVKSGRRGEFVAEVRREAENDLLAVATTLLDDGGYRAAAAVITGGALEIHLRGLCERQGVPVVGKEQLENYRTALVGARKAEASKGIDHGDAQSIVGWITARNDAAHDPVAFAVANTKEHVKLLIESVRLFIAKTT